MKSNWTFPAQTGIVPDYRIRKIKMQVDSTATHKLGGLMQPYQEKRMCFIDTHNALLDFRMLPYNRLMPCAQGKSFNSAGNASGASGKILKERNGCVHFEII